MFRFAIVLVAALWMPATVDANYGLNEAEAELALALAKVTANERSLQRARPADMALIWQVIRGHGETAKERLLWLQRHSRCLFEIPAPEHRPEWAQPPPGSNCWWTWHLDDTGAEPVNFTRYQDVRWSGLYARRWEQMRAHAQGLVAGRRPASGWPCRVTPDTWGGPMDHDRAVRLGMTPLECRGTRNEGYLYSSHSRDNQT